MDSEKHNEAASPSNPENARIDDLVRDLNALPRITAPPDFETKLLERATSVPSPWYTRLFTKREKGPLRLPFLAYGSIATIIVCIIGYYAFIHSGIPQMEEPAMLYESDVEETAKTTPPVEDSQEYRSKDTDQNEIPTEMTGHKKQLDDHEKLPESITPGYEPPIAPQVPIPRQEGIQPRESRKPDQKPTVGATEDQESRPVQSRGSESEKHDAEVKMNLFNMRLRGILLEKDSALADSLLRLDSLRRRDSTTKIRQRDSTGGK